MLVIDITALIVPNRPYIVSVVAIATIYYIKKYHKVVMHQ